MTVVFLNVSALLSHVGPGRDERPLSLLPRCPERRPAEPRRGPPLRAASGSQLRDEVGF